MQEVPPEPPLHISSFSPELPLKREMKEKETKHLSSFLRGLFLFFLSVPAFFFWAFFLLFLFLFFSFFSGGGKGEMCTVSRIPLQGILIVSNSFSTLLSGGEITTSDSFIRSLENAEKDDSISAIIIDVNSPGGTPVAGDEILSAIQKIKKPIVAVIRDVGASAAYWAIAGADHIIASPISDVGSLGVTMSYAEEAGILEKEGGRWVDISSGNYKDMGARERFLQSEEEEYLQGQVDSVYRYMIQRVQEARPLLSSSLLEESADGRVFLGVDALKLGLIDALGGFDEALLYLEKNASSSEKKILCPSSLAGGWLW